MKVCPGCGSDEPTVVSLFDGIAGFPLAFTRAGYRVVALVEIDAAAAGVAAAHFPDAAHFADVTKVTADDLIAAGFCTVCGVVCAGFPCQDLSLAGRRAGLDGARSGLFFEIVRIVADLRCRWLVLENVPGLLSSVCHCVGDNACGAGCTAAHTVRGGACGPGRCIEIHGGAMGAVLGAVAQLGYGFAYRVLDAQYAGVPQRRRRVFIVGNLGDWAAPAEVLLEPEGRERDPRAGGSPRPSTTGSTADGAAGSRREVVSAIGLSGIGGNGGPDDNAAQGGHIVGFDLAQVTSGENRSNPQPGAPSRPVGATGRPAVAYQGHGTNVGPMGTLRAGSGTVTDGVPFTLGGQVTHALTAEGADASEGGTGRGTPIVTVPTLTASMGSNNAAPGNGGKDEMVVAFGHTNGLDHQASQDLTPTLRSGRTSAAGQAAMTATAVRRLTPVECERLQGYPDGWTATGAKVELVDNRWKRVGDMKQADSARYRQLGNSVAVPVVEWIARRMAVADGVL